jgi:hypothetical protein
VPKIEVFYKDCMARFGRWGGSSALEVPGVAGN